jgi:hypothetical protein
MQIRSIQSEVTHELAWQRLSSAGASGILRRWMTGRLLGIADIYIPYHLYKVQMDDRRVSTRRLLAVDALSGNLDPFEFAEPPMQDRCVHVETRNYLPVQLSEAETHTLALAKFRRLLFSAGFFRLAKPEIAIELIEPALWAGFYGEEQSVRILALDAVRGTIEGSKVTNSVKAWLLEERHARASVAQHG